MAKETTKHRRVTGTCATCAKQPIYVDPATNEWLHGNSGKKNCPDYEPKEPDGEDGTQG